MIGAIVVTGIYLIFLGLIFLSAHLEKKNAVYEEVRFFLVMFLAPLTLLLAGLWMAVGTQP